MKHIIGITGGIGSGKSYVSRLLADYYLIPVFNCDIEAHRLMHTCDDLRASLTALVGDGLYGSDGRLNRPLMADFMFAKGRVAEVNAIVHPAVREWFGEWCRIMQHNEVVAIESAILVEAGLCGLCTEVWNVTAPLELRIERVMKRDNATRQQVLDRICRQTSDEERKKHARFTIVNDGTGDLLQIIGQRLGQLADCKLLSLMDF